MSRPLVEQRLEAAAISLKRSLTEQCGGQYPGFVGTGGTAIHVYLKAKRKLWRGETPKVWEGFPVFWHFGVGPAKALAATAPPPQRGTL